MAKHRQRKENKLRIKVLCAAQLVRLGMQGPVQEQLQGLVVAILRLYLSQLQQSPSGGLYADTIARPLILASILCVHIASRGVHQVTHQLGKTGNLIRSCSAVHSCCKCCLSCQSVFEK